MKTYRIALIGCGMISKSHFEAISSLANARVAAVADIVPEKAKKAGEAQNCPYFFSLRELLQAIPDIDVCLLATPTHTHAELVEVCAAFGKPTICEKPAGLRVADVKRLRNAVEQSDIPYMTAQVVRFWSGYTQLKQMMAEGAFGDIYMSYFSRCSQLQQWDNDWLFDPERGGGAMFDMMVHDIDFMHHLYGPAQKVYTVASKDHTGCYANVFASIDYQNGAKGVAETSFTMQAGFPFTMAAKIMGKKATAEYIYRAGDDINQRDGATCTLDIYRAGEEPQHLQPNQYNAYAAETAYFLDCLDKGIQPSAVTLDESVEVIRVVNAIERSAITGAPVDMAAFDR